MPAWLVIVLMILATYRLTTFVTRDELLSPERERFEAAHDNRLGYFVGCVYCVSVWAAGLVTLATWLALTFIDPLSPGLPVPFLVWAGSAGGAALIFDLTEK